MAHISINDWEIHTLGAIKLSPTISREAQTFKLLPFICKNTIAIHVFSIEVVLTYLSTMCKHVRKIHQQICSYFSYSNIEVYLKLIVDKYINRSSSSYNFTTLLISPWTTLTYSFVIFQYQTRSYSCMVITTLNISNI